MKKTEQLSRIDIENLLMPEIIKSLQWLGGMATKSELYDDLKENATTISEDYIQLEKVSRKTHNSYKPFDYDFNFSAKHLLLAGLLEKPARATYQLTEAGAQVNNFSQFHQSVRSVSQPLWPSSKNKSDDKDTPDNLEETIETPTWQDNLLDSLKTFSPSKFEQFCRLLVRKMGVTMDEKIGIQVSNDGGLDGFGYITSQDDFRTNRVAIQAKRWNGNIQSPEIDKFRGAMDKHNAEYGIFITTSSFSRGAIQASRQGTRVITLIDGDKIAELVAKYKLYVTEVVTYELDDFYKNKG